MSRPISIIDDIVKLSKNDNHLARLLENAVEYSELYLMAKKRQKGCAMAASCFDLTQFNALRAFYVSIDNRWQDIC